VIALFALDPFLPTQAIADDVPDLESGGAKDDIDLVETV
jgi:hypothetical protein